MEDFIKIVKWDLISLIGWTSKKKKFSHGFLNMKDNLIQILYCLNNIQIVKKMFYITSELIKDNLDN